MTEFSCYHKNRFYPLKVKWVITTNTSIIMIDSKAINSIISELGTSDEKFKSSLDKFIKLGVKIANESPEFMHELSLYETIFFHVYITDLDFNIWIKSEDGMLGYNNNLYEITADSKHIIHFILKSKIIGQIFTQKLNPAEAYFKGLMKIDGEYSDANIARNLVKMFFQYVSAFMNQD